jgi:hypothetical protein
MRTLSDADVQAIVDAFWAAIEALSLQDFMALK